MDGEPTDLRPSKARKAQIRPAVEAAIQLLVTRAVTISEAAEHVGMKRKSLAVALRKSHVAARLSAVRHEWFANQTGRAWLAVVGLAGEDAPPDVRLKAARTILEAAGELGPNRRDDTPRAPQLVQIINHGGAIDLGGGARQHSGVIEAPPYAPPPRPISTDDGDD